MQYLIFLHKTVYIFNRLLYVKTYIVYFCSSFFLVIQEFHLQEYLKSLYCSGVKLIFLDTTVCIKSFHMNTSFIKNPYMYINNITQFFTINRYLLLKPPSVNLNFKANIIKECFVIK